MLTRSSHEVTGAAAPDRLSDFDSSHRLEREVLHLLLGDPQLSFSSLTVHRMSDGVCLQGVLLVDEECPDVCTLAQKVAGVNRVVNRLTVARKPHRLPPKG